jgi:hypothetical protein
MLGHNRRPLMQKLASGATVTVNKSSCPPGGKASRYCGGRSFSRKMRRALAMPSIQSRSYLIRRIDLIRTKSAEHNKQTNLFAGISIFSCLRSLSLYYHLRRANHLQAVQQEDPSSWLLLLLLWSRTISGSARTRKDSNLTSSSSSSPNSNNK